VDIKVFILTVVENYGICKFQVVEFILSNMKIKTDVLKLRY